MGFSILDNVVEFWGVSSEFLVEGEEKVGVRLYILWRCFWDVSIIFYIWFVYYGLICIEWFEEELRLEKVLDFILMVEVFLSIRIVI